ncbi:MAG: hypothetical protein RMX96_04005 [Nostoc sp. ChiSLP02]|nr:hypothetical protein [Nostoc sp. DedSLP05]MDZ8100251.1 hypothetical protein [Nostoc sp. DedSLP01]MDZ8184011.1 hypothetical protein [Nostoc sp. ChiSLP02]
MVYMGVVMQRSSALNHNLTFPINRTYALTNKTKNTRQESIKKTAIARGCKAGLGSAIGYLHG